jgi:hypothetical protein
MLLVAAGILVKMAVCAYTCSVKLIASIVRTTSTALMGEERRIVFIVVKLKSEFFVFDILKDRWRGKLNL